MPLLWDFLIAPWKLFSLLVTVHQPITAAGQPSGATATGLCFQEVVGEQTLNVCHVLGYSMPSFVFWAALMIFALFAVSSAALIFQCDSLANSLQRVVAELERLPHGAGQRLSQADLAALGTLMGKEPQVARPWRRFEATLLVPSTAETDREIFATTSVEEAFAKNLLIEENVHGAFFGAVPGILTGVGLLMTFVAILDGLSHVSVSANMDVKGIGGLINGLSGKFVSSVVAVSCAVGFVFVERIAYSRPTRAYNELLTRLSGLFRRRTAEHLLYEIQSQLASQAQNQERFASALSRLERGRSP